MYCVMCGTFLRDDNQIGLICNHCKPEPREQKSNKGWIVQVHYCYRCGQPYQPSDTSIQHLSCFTGDMMMDISSFATNRVSVPSPNT